MDVGCRISIWKSERKLTWPREINLGLELRIVGDLKTAVGLLTSNWYFIPTLYFLVQRRKKALKNRSRREKKGRAGGRLSPGRFPS